MKKGLDKVGRTELGFVPSCWSPNGTTASPEGLPRVKRSPSPEGENRGYRKEGAFLECPLYVSDISPLSAHCLTQLGINSLLPKPPS